VQKVITEDQKIKRRAAVAKWRKNNPEADKAATKAWRERNPDKVAGQRSRYRKKHPEKKILIAAWHKANPNKIKKIMRKYYDNNYEKVYARCRTRQANVRGAAGKFCDKDIKIILERQKYKCAECKTSIKDYYEVDHVMPIALGGSNWPKNLQCLCRKCNNRKRAKHPIDWAQENGRLL